MNLGVQKIHIALILGGLKKQRKKIIASKQRFLANLEKGYYEDKNNQQKRKILRSKDYKIRVLDKLIVDFENAITKEEYRLVLSEISDFDYNN